MSEFFDPHELFRYGNLSFALDGVLLSGQYCDGKGNIVSLLTVGSIYTWQTVLYADRVLQKRNAIFASARSALPVWSQQM